MIKHDKKGTKKKKKYTIKHDKKEKKTIKHDKKGTKIIQKYNKIR